jgi:hypothetical protein
MGEMEMPQYVSHKKVWALKIESVEHLTLERRTVLLHFEDKHYAPLMSDIDKRPEPQAGWYYIVYPDGYHSFSPAKAFEGGYTLVVK